VVDIGYITTEASFIVFRLIGGSLDVAFRIYGGSGGLVIAFDKSLRFDS
jgi:hypothetical protein